MTKIKPMIYLKLEPLQKVLEFLCILNVYKAIFFFIQIYLLNEIRSTNYFESDENLGKAYF